MELILLMTFIIISFGMVAWGVMKSDRYYQFPTLTGAVWLLYLVPMAIGIYNNKDWIPDGAVQHGGYEMALLMCILCCIASIMGYRRTKYQEEKNKNIVVATYSNDRIFLCGVAMILAAYYAFFQLAALSGGVMKYFSVDGGYQLEWVGLPVMYAFFMRLIYPGLILCIFSILDKATPARIGFILISLSLPLANILIRGRRGETAILLIVLAFGLFFRKGWTPPRWIVAAALIMGAVGVHVAPAYRTHAQLGGDSAEIHNIDIGEIVAEVFSGKAYTEFHYPVIQLAAAFQENTYNYGMGYYNLFIQRWVPKLIVGEETKQELYMDLPDFKLMTHEYYGWRPVYGWIPTVVVDVFREFSFFGAFLLFYFARGYRWLWDRAYKGDVGLQLFYVTMAPFAMFTIFSGFSAMISQVIFLFIFFIPILMICRTGKAAITELPELPHQIETK